MREKEYIHKSYITIFYYCSLSAIFMGFIMLLPLLALPFYFNEADISPIFVVPSMISILLGFTVWYTVKEREKIPISLTHSAIIVTFVWFWACLMGTFPFYILKWTGSNYTSFTFLQGLFESVSGWTGTGLTVIPDVEDPLKIPRLLLLWRSLMQYIGGAGFAVIMMTIMSGPSVSGIYNAEGHTDEILPQVKQSAKLVAYIYLGYYVLGVIAYILAGMPVFDAVNHCMTALGTGGYSVKNTSIGGYNSPVIEYVSIVLMIIGGTSFVIHHFLLQKRWDLIKTHAEVKTFWLILGVFTAIMLFRVTLPHPEYRHSFELAFRRSLFEITSAMTGTGFNTVSYSKLPDLGNFLLILMMLAGGNTGSTSGAIKHYRLYLIARFIFWNIREQFIPKSAVVQYYVMRGDKKTFINDRQMREVYNFVLVYILIFFTGSMALMMCGVPLRDALFEFASTMGNVGDSIGITGYTTLPAVTVIQIIGMFIGRLEFFVIAYCLIKLSRDTGIILSPEVKKIKY